MSRRISPPPRLAAIADAVGLAIFVIAGRQSHEIGFGLTWFLTVFWPFLVGWFAVAAVTHIYTRPQWRSIAMCWLGGTGIAFVLRAVLTGRPTPLAFILVALSFIAAINFGWRAVWVAANRRIFRGSATERRPIS